MPDNPAVHPLAEELRLISAKEAAELTGLPLNRIEELTRECKIPHVRIGGRVYYRPEKIKHWLDEIETVPETRRSAL